MFFLCAVEAIHMPQSVRANDEALLNILAMLVTLDTSHSERSPSNKIAPENMLDIIFTLDTSHFERSPLK